MRAQVHHQSGEAPIDDAAEQRIRRFGNFRFPGFIQRQHRGMDFFYIFGFLDQILHGLGGHVAGFIHEKPGHLGLQAPAAA